MVLAAGMSVWLKQWIFTLLVITLLQMLLNIAGNNCQAADS